MAHTGDICTQPGLFQCPMCGQTVRMLANPKDHFPPCPHCKSGVHYNEISLTELAKKSVKVSNKIKKAVVGSNDK